MNFTNNELKILFEITDKYPNIDDYHLINLFPININEN